MKRKLNQGFTLIEIAIVLVIIGLLLGGVLKGQELINSAKVKNLATDFRNIPLYIYGYQDKFKALPGDDARVATNLPGATLATTPAGMQGNGVIDGLWIPATPATDETSLFWQHVRLAGLAAGATSPADPNYQPHRQRRQLADHWPHRNLHHLFRRPAREIRQAARYHHGRSGHRDRIDAGARNGEPDHAGERHGAGFDRRFHLLHRLPRSLSTAGSRHQTCRRRPSKLRNFNLP
jgi:prepilin-type N-terminal cleavage/methylation domain-containing protein